MPTEAWDGTERREGECVADPARVCPWTDPERLEQAEKRIARDAGEIAGKLWWSGFPWGLFLGMLAIVGTLTGVLWRGIDSSVMSVASRVSVVETSVGTHMVSNATTSAQLDGLKSEVARLSAEINVLSAAFNTRNDLVSENNAMLRKMLDREKARQ